MVTPTRPVDLRAKWGARYFQAGGPVNWEHVAAGGATILNMHRAPLAIPRTEPGSSYGSFWMEIPTAIVRSYYGVLPGVDSGSGHTPARRHQGNAINPWINYPYGGCQRI